MEQNEAIEMQLWAYIDGTGNDAEREHIAQQIATDPFWKEQYDLLCSLHTAISAGIDAEQPSMRFTKNVMEAVAGVHVAPATKRYINPAIIRGIAAFFIIGITVLLGYAFMNVNWSEGPSSAITGTGLNNLHLNAIFSSAFFNILIAVNVVLGLVLLDKFLQRKSTTTGNTH